jgi:uncharacterized protein involved in exopolysaccharide biosynthesis
MDKKAESFVSIVDLWRICFSRWRWFAVSVALCLTFAVRYLIVTPFLYTRYASIMLHEENLGDNAYDNNSNKFNEIGFVKQKTNVSDEVRHITSLDILMEVVCRLHPTQDRKDLFDVAVDMQSRLSAEVQEKGSSIIDMTYHDYSTIEAAKTLELIIQVYNEKWLQEKQKAIQNTSHFIDSRLELLERELNIVDDSISS